MSFSILKGPPFSILTTSLSTARNKGVFRAWSRMFGIVGFVDYEDCAVYNIATRENFGSCEK